MKRVRRFWLATLCTLLAAAFLLPGCTELPETILPGKPVSWQEWEWKPTYNDGLPLNIHAAYSKPGIYWEELSPEKIAALTPSVRMDWMQIRGAGCYYSDGTPFYLVLEIATRGNVVQVLIGEHDPCVMYEQETAEVTRCAGVTYRLYRKDQNDREFRLEATAIINDEPMHFVMYTATEADIVDFETVLQCFATYPEGKPSLEDGVAVPADTTERSDWTPIYNQIDPDTSGVMVNHSYYDTNYEELRPEQLAMILPQQRPFWMKTLGYTFFYSHDSLSAFRLRTLHLDIETRLPEYDIGLSAREIPREILDVMTEREAKEGREGGSISVCHGVEFLIYEYVDDLYFTNDVTLEAVGRINNFHCVFTMWIPKEDKELLQQAKAEFETVLESYCRAGQKGELFWDNIHERGSNEYDRKDMTWDEAYIDGVFGPYVSAIGHDGTMEIHKICRDAFYKTDELNITFAGAEDTFEWQFQRDYGHQAKTVKPGQEIEFRTPIYAVEDVTEELLRSRFQEHPETGVGIQFENMLLLIDNSEHHVSWIYEQIVRIHEQTKNP